MSSTRRSRLLLWGFPLLAGVLLAVSYRFRAFVVRSDSMEPTLHHGDVVLASRRHGPLVRGGIYGFRGPEHLLLKRLVGLPGDAVALRGQKLLRNGRPVAEPWAHYLQGGIRDLPACILGEGEVLLLGDSRDRSQDSRDFGPVPLSRLTGRIRYRIWPPTRWGRVR